MSTKIYARDGKTLLKEIPDTQPHPLGSGARNHLGQHLSGPLTGTWEPNSPDAPWHAGSRAQLILAAMSAVPTSKKSAWTVTGKPKVEAIEGALKDQVTEYERDCLWKWTRAANAAAAAEAKRQAEGEAFEREVLAGSTPDSAGGLVEAAGLAATTVVQTNVTFDPGAAEADATVKRSKR